MSPFLSPTNKCTLAFILIYFFLVFCVPQAELPLFQSELQCSHVLACTERQSLGTYLSNTQTRPPCNTPQRPQKDFYHVLQFLDGFD